jgi:hypothetical protein
MAAPYLEKSCDTREGRREDRGREENINLLAHTRVFETI